MARIVIREQDLTGNRIDQDFTDIAFIPGFVKYPKEEYSTPQLCLSEAEFIDMFGNEPAVAATKFSYNVKYKSGDQELEVLNPETGSTMFYLDTSDIESVSDSAYHYARELLYRGLPIYYCPVNEKEAIPTDEDGKECTTCNFGPEHYSIGGHESGKLKPYDGRQNEGADSELLTLGEDEKALPEYKQFIGIGKDYHNYNIPGTETQVPSYKAADADGMITLTPSASATVYIRKKGSSDEIHIEPQGGSEKFYVPDEEAEEGQQKYIVLRRGLVQDQILPYNYNASYAVQVEGYGAESFNYKWYIEEVSQNDGSADEGDGAAEEPKKKLISTSQILKFNTLTYGSAEEDVELKISVEITAIPSNAVTVADYTSADGKECILVEAPDGKDLLMNKIISVAKAKAIDKAIEYTQNIFAQQMINFFCDTENTELIKDRGLYNFKYMTTGGYPLFEAATISSDGTSTDLLGWERALGNLLEVVGQKTVDDSKDYIAEDGSTQRQGRGDCILLIDHMKDKCQDTMDLYQHVREWFEDPANVNDEALEFAAMFTPWCNYAMTYTSHNVDVDLPASFAYLSCLADSIQAYDNWHAISGVTRGTVKNINSILLRNPLTNTKANKCQADPETAEAGRVSINCITEIKPYGQVIWGNRTLQKADRYKHVTAMGFLNLRNEVSDIKKLVYRAARRWMFEQNTSVLWVNFKSTITPLLERMVNGYGLTRYEIRKGEKTAKHKLYAEIRIWPIYAVEYIDVTIQILDEDTIVTEE